MAGLRSHSTVSFWHTDALHKEGVSLAGGFRRGATVRIPKSEPSREGGGVENRL